MRYTFVDVDGGVMTRPGYLIGIYLPHPDEVTQLIDDLLLSTSREPL